MSLYKLVCYFVATIFCLGSVHAEPETPVNAPNTPTSCDTTQKSCDSAIDNLEEAVFSIFNKPSAEDSKNLSLESEPIHK